MAARPLGGPAGCIQATSKPVTKERLGKGGRRICLSARTFVVVSADPSPPPPLSRRSQRPAPVLQPKLGPFPGFLLDRGRYATIEARNPRLQVVPAGINEQGEIVGEVIVDNSKG